jgi:hypothetical protein
MDLPIYAKDFTQHDLFGLLPDAPAVARSATHTAACTWSQLPREVAGPRLNAMERAT